MAESPESLVLATFSPRETEQITGVSQATQRDWRRRELTSFETRKGRKRFTTIDLAYLVVMKQLLPIFRPEAAFMLARISSVYPVHILARRAYPRAQKIDGQVVKDVHRFAAYSRLMDGQQLVIHTAADLDDLTLHAKTGGSRKKSQYPVAFHVILDHYEIADQLQLKQVKPYFLEEGTA